jgi:hypothetical protein
MSIRWPVVLAVLVPLLLGTAVVFGVGFGVMTACTDTYSCTVTGCAPCRSTSSWLNAGWAAQGVLLIAAVALAATARRGLGPAVVRTATFAIVCLSVLAIVVTTALAVHSY